MERRDLTLNELLLDPNNYRLQEQEDYVHVDENRFHLDRVQAGTLTRLRKENIRPLRDSIVSNRFLEIERIVVTPYQHLEGKYLVIEGNRRIAALLQIRDEYNTGIDISEDVVGVFDAVPCLVADQEGQEAFFRETLMGIRHVGGIKQWGGFQRAKLIADLHDEHDLDAGAISQKLGLSVQEVNRRYRAYKALQQMQNDEAYSEFATASMYPLFHEAVSLPIVRDWLGWSAADLEFRNEENKETFYQLLTPRNPGEDDEREPKIRTFSEVRQLREILPNNDARAELLQIDREFVDALAVATQENMTRRWRNEVVEARTALAKIPGEEIQRLSVEDIQSLNDLARAATNVIEMHRRLAAPAQE